MEIGEWSATPDLNGIFNEIRGLGLETNLAELEAFGFTVIEGALSAELNKQVLAAVIKAAQEFHKMPLDLQNEQQLQNVQHVPFLFFRDRVFEKVALNEKPLALITYLLGRHCVMMNFSSHVKGPGGVELPIHSDTANGVPEPFSPYSHVANCNYALTDYTMEAGALAIVPGSHRMARRPSPRESKLTGNDRNPHAIPIEVPAGSAIIWHGNTWHGSYPRQMPGLRVNLAVAYSRQYYSPYELYKDRLPSDFFERHHRDSRMAQLLGLNSFAGFHEEGPKPENVRHNLGVGHSWYD